MTKRATVCHWSESFNPKGLGGVSSHINYLVQNLKSYEHLILSNDNKHSRININQKKFKTFSSNIFNRKSRLISGKKYYSYPFKLIDELETFRHKINFVNSMDYDIFHLHGIELYATLKNLNKWFKSSIYEKFINFNSITKPKVLTLHNFFPGFTNEKAILDLYNYYIEMFDIIICVDKAIYDYCLDYCEMANKSKKIHLIYNSVENESQITFFKNRKKLRIGFVGRIARTLDVEILNKLISKIPDDF